MNAQRQPGPVKSSSNDMHRLVAGQAVSVSAWPGELTVVDGRVWLTRRGDLADHVLEAGQRLRLQAGDAAVIEGWASDSDAVVRWMPLPQRRARAPLVAAALAVGVAAGLGLLAGLAANAARVLAGATRRLEAWARSAASSARRAQGRICIGESMACGGTVQ